MSGTVRVARKWFRSAMAFLEDANSSLAADLHKDGLRFDPPPSEKKRDAKKRNAGEKKSAKQRHNEETAEIRAKDCERANGYCENLDCYDGEGHWIGYDGEGAHMDHFRGKKNARQSIVNTWLLCFECDHAKTNNKPDRATWLDRYRRHCTKHGYTAEAAWAHSEWETETDLHRLDSMTRGGDSR